jgi:threonine dehydrogenase-like Zn-dependent dehydrogenase
VLVRVRAAGVCRSDLELLEGTRPPAFVKYPVIPGHEWCGTLEALGAGVDTLSVGQRVAAEGHAYCRSCAWCRQGDTNLCATYSEHGFTLPGGFAEYAVVRADLVHPFSARIGFDAAALAEPLACVVHGARRACLQAGATVVVVGPGTLGLLFVARAKLSRPSRLVAVAVDRSHERLARSLGATDYVIIDEDPVAQVMDVTEGRGADVVLEAAGSPEAVWLALAMARRGGAVALTGIAGGGQRAPLDTDVFCLKDLRVHGVFAYASRDFGEALRLIDGGAIDVKSLVTHTLPLGEFGRAFELLSGKEPAVKVLLRP